MSPEERFHHQPSTQKSTFLQSFQNPLSPAFSATACIMSACGRFPQLRISQSLICGISCFFSSLRRHFPHLIFPCTESVENNADLLSIFHKLYICQSIYVESGLSQGPIFIDFPRIIYLSIRSCGIYGNDNSGRRAGRRTSATKNLPPTCRHCRHFMNLQKMSSVGSFGVFLVMSV